MGKGWEERTDISLCGQWRKWHFRMESRAGVRRHASSKRAANPRIKAAVLPITREKKYFRVQKGALLIRKPGGTPQHSMEYAPWDL